MPISKLILEDAVDPMKSVTLIKCEFHSLKSLKHSGFASKKTRCVAIMQIKLTTLFKDTIALNS
jgi:hypothetical protein